MPEKEPTKPGKEKHERSADAVSLITGTRTKKSMKSLSSRFGEYNTTPAKKWKEETDEIITISVPVSETAKPHKIPVKEKQPTQKGRIFRAFRINIEDMENKKSQQNDF